MGAISQALLAIGPAAVPGLLSPFYPTNLYSFRLRNAAYTGPCCRVRRTSDNALFDIGFNAATGLVSSADINSALSGHVSDTLAMSIWYDQSGNGDHATQTTATSQPLLASAGTPQANGEGFVCPAYNGTAHRMFVPNTTRLDYTADFSLEVLANSALPSPGGQTRYLDITYPTSQQGLVYLVGSAAHLFINGTDNTLATATVGNGSTTNVAWTRSGSANRVFVTGAQTMPTVTNFQNFTGNVLYIGNDIAGTSQDGVSGNVFEVRLTKGTAVQTSNYTPWSTS